MKTKKILIVLSLVIVLLVSFTVFAAASDSTAAKNIRGFFGIDTSKLTDEQKADLDDSLDKMTELQKDTAKKMAELQKEAVNKMVANGSMTKEQGDAAIKKIDEMAEKAEKNGFPMGMGMKRDGSGILGIDKFDAANLTDQQKADLKDAFNKIAAYQKEAVNKLVANGSITKAQGDAAIAKINEAINSFDANGLPKSMGILKGGLGFFTVKDLDVTKLTDQQRSDLKDCYKKIAELGKETINKMVTNGSITKEQGDSALGRVDNMLKNIEENGFTNAMGMGKGGFGKKGNRNLNAGNTSNQ